MFGLDDWIAGLSDEGSIAVVVAVAVLGSLTVLPALLSKLGDRVDRLRVPLVGRLRRDDGEGRIWGAIVDRVLRRPVLSAAAATAVLVALAAPALQLKLAADGPESFPKGLEVIKAYDRMQEAFPGAALPATVVVKAADVEAPAVQAALDRLDELDEFLGTAPPTVWIEAARLHHAGTPAAAAEVLQRAGSRTDAARTRLTAAERYQAAARHAEADEQLHEALAFYRGVGATRYVRLGERLLAASA